MNKTKSILIILALLSVFGINAEPVNYRPAQSSTYLEQIQSSFRSIADRILPVVVEIDVVDVVKQQVSPRTSPFDFFFRRPNDKEEEQQEPTTREFRRPGLGSGVIVRKTGNKVYVLSNNHVVGDADEIKVTLYDGREYDAKLVGKDSRKDLALVVFETKESNIPVAELGNSSETRVGDLAFAIGNPLGFESTFTMGIVSAIGRDSAPIGGSTFTDYIQTDAAINQGNSGGALVNIYGQIIGINTWIASQTGGSIGLGFSIPIDNAKKAIDDFITSGKVEYGWLGIHMSDPSSEVKKSLKMEKYSGSFVHSVYKNSPAMKSGIRPGDLIIAVDNQKIENSDKLLKVVGNLVPNKTYNFKYIRMGKSLSSNVKIVSRKPEDSIQKTSKELFPGMSVVVITDQIRKQLDLDKNIGELMIGSVENGSPANAAGFKSGDIIKEINKKKVKDAADYFGFFTDKKTKELIFKVNRQGTEILLGLVL